MRYLIKEQKYLDNCLKEIAKLPVGQGWAVEIAPYDDLRTGAQNRTCHMWLSIIEKTYGYPKGYLKNQLKIKLGLFTTHVDGDTVYRDFISSADFSKEQMMDFMTAIEMVANELEVKLIYPQDYKEF